jgi:hypothetical protein
MHLKPQIMKMQVDAVRGVKFEVLPEVLSLHLLRFTFDLERMRRVKV